MPTQNSRGIDYWLQQNRDYFLTPKAGYRPYKYPHPLRAYKPSNVVKTPG